MRRRWGKRAASTGILGSAATWLLWVMGSLPSERLLAAGVMLLVTAALGSVWWSASDLPRPAEPASWYAVRRDHSPAPPALDYRLVRLRRDLRDATQSSERPDTIYWLVRSLTADRLRERHGIDLDLQTDLAAPHLSDPLRSYLAHPPIATERRSVAVLSDALTGIEEL